MKTMSNAQTTRIRGFQHGTVGCPEHGAMCVWTAITDPGPLPELELVKYSCGCIVSWVRDLYGNSPTFEHRGLDT